MELLIKGGTVVTATESFPADVAVDGGKHHFLLVFVDCFLQG